MAVTKGPKLKVSKMTPKPAKNRRKGNRGKPKGASEYDKLGVFIKAEKRRVEEEFENDIAPTVEKTRAAASTTGRTRSQRSGVLTPKKGITRKPLEGVLVEIFTRGGKGRGYTLDRDVKGPGGWELKGKKVNTKNYDWTPMTDLPSSGAGRAAPKPKYEGTPNTLETKSETIPAPKRG